MPWFRLEVVENEAVNRNDGRRNREGGTEALMMGILDYGGWYGYDGGYKDVIEAKFTKDVESCSCRPGTVRF